MNDSILRIDRNTVHRICSGQVVLSLGVAVKELVENSIDASATNIEVRLKEYGSELIEVSDNGTGVREENFQALSLKHCTSKIREFNDLEEIQTLGFRGEALSSLCALSTLEIVTRHRTSTHATKLVYDNDGGIISKAPVAREEGTTVSLYNIFSTLPVRKIEFVKNLKREFNKMCQLLHAYCLVSNAIKFTCTNQTDNGRKSVIVTTEGLKTVRENIINVFGATQIATLIDVNLIPPYESVLEEYGLKLTPDVSLPFTFEFYISSAMHGYGRSGTDRQFYYINSRPFEPIKLMKLVNEIYKQFNSNQYPFVYLNIDFKKSHVDVNVTPDKRQIFISNEKLLFSAIKSALLDAFKNFPSTYKFQNMDIARLNASCKSTVESKSNQPCSLKRSITDAGALKDSSCGSVVEFITKRTKFGDNLEQSHSETKVEKDMLTNFKSSERERVTVGSLCTETQYAPKGALDSTVVDLDMKNDIIKEAFEDIPSQSFITLDNNTLEVRKSQQASTSLKTIKELLLRSASKKCEKSEAIVKFRSRIIPELNSNAEKELEKQLAKTTFKKMSIIGQFNNSFIITRFQNDLFIIDQHACDEKYNFEELQRSTVMESQNLVLPKPLELTAGNEAILIENQEMFNKNGFIFVINHNAPSTKKVLLTAVPMSKNVIFGKDDIDEMLFMLQDGAQGICRPSKIRQMLASRACRKSVMVGLSMSHADMRKLVVRMEELDQPWLCD